MNIKMEKHDTFTIENFLTDSECKSIIKYLDWQVETKRLDWNQISFYGSLAMGYWPSDPSLTYFGLYPDYFNDLKSRIKKATEDAFGEEMVEISFHAQKWKEGGFADYHSDNSDEFGNPTPFERSKFATFIYLNDNFDGGLLKFKGSDLALKPRKGLLATFAGGHENMHMVTTVENGERYTVGSFWDKASSQYTDEQRKAWEKELAEIRADQEVLYKKWDLDAENGMAPTLPGE